MPRVLLTAFEPYDRWLENSSWLALVELIGRMPNSPALTTRKYPVDFERAFEQLTRDLESAFDAVLHLGQAPGASAIQLESMALNVRGELGQRSEEYSRLESDGPMAYQTQLPIGRWANHLRRAGIPATVSYHAGTYLCNAVFYWTHHFSVQRGLPTRAAFLHLPMATSQVLSGDTAFPSLPTSVVASGLRLILEDIDRQFQRSES